MDETTSTIVIYRDVIFNASDFNKDRDTSSSVNCFDDDVFSDEKLVSQSPDEMCQEDNQLRYPRRQRRPPVRYGIDEYIDMAFLGEAAEDPESIEEALQSRLSKQWQEVADAEFQSLIDDGACSVTQG